LSKGLLLNARWAEAIRATERLAQRCAHFNQSTRSRCLEGRGFGIWAQIAARGPTPADDAALDALAADIVTHNAGGDAPLIVERVRAELAAARGLHADAAARLRALRPRLIARYALVHDEVRRLDERLRGAP
jgi:hypothetical protein